MATHDNTASGAGSEQEVGRSSKPGGRKPGRRKQPLSPNGVDKELASEQAKAPQRRARRTRSQTVAAKRLRDLLRQVRRKQRKAKRLGDADAGRVVRQRVRCVRRYLHLCTRLSEREAAAQTATAFACSSATVRQLVRRYRRGGLAALQPQPRGPKAPVRQVPHALERLVVMLRVLYGWNEKRMAKELERRGLGRVSHTTVGHIFRRNHLPTRTYHSKARAEGVPYRRYEKQWPNAQWHLDFAQVTLEDGDVVRLVVVIDDYSRFCLACEVIETTSTEAVRLLFLALCQRYGFQPQEVVTDNDRAFVSVYEDVPTRFAQELAAHHVRHRPTSPYYPEGNGKAEAFIKTLKAEALSGTFPTRAALRTALEEFQEYYNFYRLHSSLDYQPPAVRYWGVEAPVNHRLAGLPGLPTDLALAYPPHPSFQPVATNPALRRQAFALVPVNC